MNLNKVRYIYMGNRSNQLTHNITIAYTRDDHKIYFGVAYGRNDDRYSKKFGKSLAIERLLINGNDGIDIIDGQSVYDTIWDYLFENKRGTRLTYNKPSWVNEVMLVHNLKYKLRGYTTRELYNRDNSIISKSFIGKLLEFFGFK